MSLFIRAWVSRGVRGKKPCFFHFKCLHCYSQFMSLLELERKQTVHKKRDFQSLQLVQSVVHNFHLSFPFVVPWSLFFFQSIELTISIRFEFTRVGRVAVSWKLRLPRPYCHTPRMAWCTASRLFSVYKRWLSTTGQKIFYLLVVFILTRCQWDNKDFTPPIFFMQSKSVHL